MTTVQDLIDAVGNIKAQTIIDKCIECWYSKELFEDRKAILDIGIDFSNDSFKFAVADIERNVELRAIDAIKDFVAIVKFLDLYKEKLVNMHSIVITRSLKTIVRLINTNRDFDYDDAALVNVDHVKNKLRNQLGINNDSCETALSATDYVRIVGAVVVVVLSFIW